jgi:hypothetical protein
MYVFIAVINSYANPNKKFKSVPNGLILYSFKYEELENKIKNIKIENIFFSYF